MPRREEVVARETAGRGHRRQSSGAAVSGPRLPPREERGRDHLVSGESSGASSWKTVGHDELGKC